MSTALVTLGNKLAERFGMGENGQEVIAVLKATAFKGPATDAQLTALMIVAQQYALNPFTKEIFAFPDKNNGIVPVVGVDGWSRIINNHPQFDGMEFEQDAESCTCIIFRKDRGHPIKVTEYMAECKRPNVGPWTSHPRRMLRHKSMIQCARLAFGYGGIYDQDEAERIVEEKVVHGEVIREEPKQIPVYDSHQFDVNFPKWQDLIKSGKKTADQIVAIVSSKATLTEAQIEAIRDCEVEEADEVDPFVAALEAAEGE